MFIGGKKIIGIVAPPRVRYSNPAGTQEELCREVRVRERFKLANELGIILPLRSKHSGLLLMAPDGSDFIRMSVDKKGMQRGQSFCLLYPPDDLLARTASKNHFQPVDIQRTLVKPKSKEARKQGEVTGITVDEDVSAKEMASAKIADLSCFRSIWQAPVNLATSRQIAILISFIAS